jgi:phosphohistidine phosphatase
MDLILWRHCEAEPGNPIRPAPDVKGLKQAERMAAWLDAHLPDTYVSPADARSRPRRCSANSRRAGAGPGATVSAVLAAANWPEVNLARRRASAAGTVASFLLSGEEAYWSVRKGAGGRSNRAKEGGAAVVLKVAEP